MPEPPSAQGNVRGLPPANEPRLESWGEIALYLKRDIRTVQRWEKHFGLPVRRLKIGKQGQVYAYRSELDRWVQERQPKPEEDKVVVSEEAADGEEEIGTEISNTGDEVGPKQNDLIAPPPPKPRSGTWKWMAAAAVLILVGLGAYTILPLVQSNRVTKILLFVRPFTSLGNSADQQLFVKGLKDETIIQLGKLDPAHLGVFAPTTSDEYGNASIQKLKGALRTDYVLEGSVRLVNEQLRIDTALISAADQNQVWANSYTGNQTDVLKLQDEITADVAKEIARALPQFEGRVTQESKPGTDSEAYQAYMEGRVHWLDRDVPRSLAAYQKALEKNPNYAPALAGLSAAYLLLGETPNDVMRPDVAIPKARKAAEQALAIDPTQADALCVLANIAQGYDHNLPEAERLFKKAIEVDPSNVTAHEWYGYYLVVMNRMNEAEREIKRALEIDPASPLLNTTYAELRYYQRDYDGAIAQAKKTLQDYPGFFLPRFWMGSAYREKRMYPEAIEQFHLARQESNDSPSMVQAEASALGLSGDNAGARKLLGELQAASRSRFVPAIYFAAIHQGLGERDEVFHWLDEAYKERDDRLPYLGVEPMTDPLRSDPRFKELMKKVGLPDTIAYATAPGSETKGKPGN